MSFTTKEHVLHKAGEGVSEKLNEGSASNAITHWISQAEGVIDSATGKNFTVIYEAITNEAKLILNDCASSLAAIQAIQYDMSGYTSRYEAETMLDVQRDTAMRAISLLRDKNVTHLLLTNEESQ